MMKRSMGIFLLLQALLVGACGDSVSPEPSPETDPVEGPITITVATCNVLKPEGRRAEMALDKSIVQQTLAKSIKSCQADIIGFNELDETLIDGGRYSLKLFCNILNYSWSLEWPNAPHENNTATYSYANGFAYNKTLFKLEESGYVWLSKEEITWYNKPAAAYHNAGSPARTCVWARMTHIASRKSFWLFVTHLPTSSQGGSYIMAKALNKFVAQKAGDTPSILTGDMNCSPAMSNVASTATYRALIGYWTDGNIESTTGTMSGSSSSYYYTTDVYSNGHPERRIDHIMTRGCTADHYHTVISTYTEDGTVWCPSDHLPLVATITIE